MRFFCKFAFSFLIILSTTGTAFALTQGENFLVTQIKGFKQGFIDKKNGMLMVEYVPQGETVQNWTEMHTVQIIYGIKIPTDQFLARIGQGFKKGCDEVEAKYPTKGLVNGYQSEQIFFSCTKEKQTGKGSLTLFRVIQGNDSFYVIQRAWRGAPFKSDQMPISNDKFKSWMAYMESVSVCDTRGKLHPCPSVTK